MRKCSAALRHIDGMDYDEIWGISFPRVSGYFASLGDVEKHSDSFFTFGNARIELEELPEKKMGSMRIARTNVKITGTDADEIYRRFYLRFLSAGG